MGRIHGLCLASRCRLCEIEFDDEDWGEDEEPVKEAKPKKKRHKLFEIVEVDDDEDEEDEDYDE